MKVKIEFSVDNAAFEDDMEHELKCVLLSCAHKILAQQERRAGCVCDAPEVSDKILDINGNTIGAVQLVEE